MSLLGAGKRWELRLSRAAELARMLRERGERVDLLATDTPYSAKTHSGHNALLLDGRKAVGYSPWAEEDVKRFVGEWSPLTAGWFCSITDHVLMPFWIRELERAGRYAFPPLPMVVTGSRLRMRGDGPSPWTYQVVLARPIGEPFSSWGTTRGAYLGPREKLWMPGGKPMWAMREIIEDYALTGQVVCDPCCGAGTTLVAAVLQGCIGLGSDVSMEHAGVALERLEYVSTRVDAPGPRPRMRAA
jgi:hypothetical protein